MNFREELNELIEEKIRTKELAETLSKIAQQEGISVNELVVQCCNFAIANMDVTEDKNKQLLLCSAALMHKWMKNMTYYAS